MKPFDPRLLRRAGSARLFIAATVGLGALTAVAVVVQAVSLAVVLSRVVDRRVELHSLGGWLAVLAAAVIARGALAMAQEATAGRSASTVKSELRAQLLQRVIEEGPARLSDERAGRIAVLAGQGLDALDAYFARYLPQLVLTGLVPPLVLAIVAATDWRSAIVLGVTLPLVPLFMALIGMATRQRTARQWQALSRLGTHFLDVVDGLTTLRVFGRARRQAGILRTMAEEHRRSTMGTLRLAFLSSMALELLTTLGTALVAVIVGLRLLDGQLELRTAFLVLLLAPEAYLPLRQVGASFHASADGVEAASEALDLLDTPAGAASLIPGEASSQVGDLPPPRSAPGRNAPLAAGRGVKVRFAGVSFRYPRRESPALQDVDFELASGEHVALTGPSGSGKSSVQAVLLGFVVPDSGKVLVDDHDLRELDLDRWRQRVTWVPQRPHIFSASLADNLRVAAPGATDAQLRDALIRARGGELLERLPSGLDTPLGAGGYRISAGERQRIAIARASLRDADLVLLDEPTANLDTRTEADVLDAIDELWAGRTLLVIDHRAAAAARADRVLVMDGARLLTATSQELPGGRHMPVEVAS